MFAKEFDSASSTRQDKLDRAQTLLLQASSCSPGHLVCDEPIAAFNRMLIEAKQDKSLYAELLELESRYYRQHFHGLNLQAPSGGNTDTAPTFTDEQIVSWLVAPILVVGLVVLSIILAAIIPGMPSPL